MNETVKKKYKLLFTVDQQLNLSRLGSMIWSDRTLGVLLLSSRNRCCGRSYGSVAQFSSRCALMCSDLFHEINITRFFPIFLSRSTISWVIDYKHAPFRRFHVSKATSHIYTFVKSSQHEARTPPICYQRKHFLRNGEKKPAIPDCMSLKTFSAWVQF